MNYRAMRREGKIVTNQEKINNLLNSCKVGYLGLVDDEGTYVVPLNYVWKDEKIYFHGSEQGRKVDAIRTNNRVCFTITEDRGIIANPAPANIGTDFSSVMVFGKIRTVDHLEEATDALQAMLDKFVPGYFERELEKKYVESYRSSLGSKTVVYCLEVDQITAKEATVARENLFYPGRKQRDDLKKEK
ncbi:pyridoxamine 5'-phosphate oxidase family protein [Calidifontibacillus oryziterrae]|uniref:pyridoxamine 5'-phosphate oxidase family protein n=1 Tax=Calidifontibacillus oryziterrae TaxID=1191699 RepID=UPI0002E1A245|nr:pyridoxamine 5'-phosphate oxidase family protein [Calidifontibacillus oryziterrae]